ncbi:28S ribosomal protein S7, mitochondrial [Sitodiplosis mosellana]|uniref:28S ribosomal protein S7, mitochondrial n=1 Tax=Sitodiplosis mosellana TaxID=263140 RepID=UPI00244510E6|nr:28S ribosomal protein S7, mitochondrial [Sitodiplosis mosellana]
MLRKLIVSTGFVKSHALNARWMSVYPPYYIEPIVKKEDQERLKEENTFKELAHKKIKAAKTNVTSSSLQDPVVSKFINYIMEGGKKELAREVLEKGFQNIKRSQLERYNLAKTDEEREAIELNPRVLLHQAIENCRPLMRLVNVKRGGTNYKVPIPITEKRSYFMSMKWLVEAGNDKAQPVRFADKIAWEIIDAANNTGRVIKRKQDLHKECEANRAYAHYRWLS